METEKARERERRGGEEKMKREKERGREDAVCVAGKIN